MESPSPKPDEKWAPDVPETGTCWRDVRDDDIAMLMAYDRTRSRVRMRCLSTKREGVRPGVEAWFALEAFRQHWVPFELNPPVTINGPLHVVRPRPLCGGDDGR